MIDHIEPGFPSQIVDGCDVDEQVEQEARVIPQKCHYLREKLRANNGQGVALRKRGFQYSLGIGGSQKFQGLAGSRSITCSIVYSHSSAPIFHA